MGEINILKIPEFENDDYLIRVPGFAIDTELINKLLTESDYLRAKYISFAEKDVSTEKFAGFTNRPSLRNVEQLNRLTSSIYTYSVEERNGIPDYSVIMSLVKRNLEDHEKSRRIVLRFLNEYSVYNSSETRPLDVSCLAFIHYFYVDEELNVKFVFRASDVKNELIFDVLTLYSFFILPVTDEKVCLSIYSTTAQNYDSFNDFIGYMNKIKLEEPVDTSE